MKRSAEPLEALLLLQRVRQRGPEREALYALWLTVRVALDIGLTLTGREERANQKRAGLLGERIHRMALPPVMQRGFATAIQHLAEATPSSARIGLTQLVAPTRELLGRDAAEAVSLAARLILERQRAQDQN